MFRYISLFGQLFFMPLIKLLKKIKLSKFYLKRFETVSGLQACFKIFKTNIKLLVNIYVVQKYP